MSADDAAPTDSLTPDTDSHPSRTPDGDTRACSSGRVRQTAAYWSMQRTMSDLS
jgi:hypothetical protein